MKKSFRYTFLLTLALITGCGAMKGPGDIVVANPVQMVADARRMISEKANDTKVHKGWIYPATLPASLQIPGLVYAEVYPDHMNFVIARNPDWKTGARVWAANCARQHTDRKTTYADIHFFSYTNDRPESPDNIK